MEAPNSKHQITNKSQRPKFKFSNKVVLVIGYWYLEFIGDLSFGIWNFRLITSLPIKDLNHDVREKSLAPE